MFSAVLKKDDLNQISLTGIRAIAVLGLLMIEPRSLQELKDLLTGYKLIDENQPNDIIRVDLNTLKYVGCKISRASQKTNHRFVLEENPFSLQITDEDIKILKKVYNQIKQDADIQLLIDYHILFEKIAAHIFDKDIKESFLGISVLKYYDIDKIREILWDCKQERTLNLVYYNPANGKEHNKVFVAQKLVYKNNKLYLYGYDIEKKSSGILNFKFIKRILARKLSRDEITSKRTVIKFHLTDFGTEVLADEENVIEAGDNGYLVEGSYHNDFIAMQRILSFGEKCTVVEPEDFKVKIINKLKEMKDIYEG